mmetsp:Transcript_23538/g.34862  ORF Transcript_23538/g.34862 Transcript_23538/m.34862 type:complete len:105 (-) Transcript_23538:465-779(-)
MYTALLMVAPVPCRSAEYCYNSAVGCRSDIAGYVAGHWDRVPSSSRNNNLQHDEACAILLTTVASITDDNCESDGDANHLLGVLLSAAHLRVGNPIVATSNAMP